MESLPSSLPAFLWHFVKKQKLWFLLLGVVHLGWSVDQTVFPYAFKLFLDRILTFTGDRHTIWPVIAGPVLMGAGIWIMTMISFRVYDYVNAFVTPRFEAMIRLAMTRYVQHHSFTYFADNFSGNLSNKISDMTSSATQVVQLILALFIPTVAAFIIGIAFFASVQPIFAVVLGCWFLVHVVIVGITSKRCDEKSCMRSDSRSDLTGKIVDLFTNISNVKLFSRHRFEIQHLSHFQDDEKGKHQSMLKQVLKARLCMDLAHFPLIGITLFSLLLYRWQNDLISSADFVYVFYTSWGLSMMAWISGIEMPRFFSEWGTCKQALSIIQARHGIIDPPEAKALEVTRGRIVFDDVTFFYDNNNPLFTHKTVAIEAGQKVGLVGFSGSGKSTFVNLILRFFDVKSGRITIDGQCVNEVTQNSLRAAIAMIPQDTTLFHRSLRENIRYGREQASDEDVLAASKRAHAHEFIKKIPQQYDALVGERGVKISGGQRQRIAIARALLKDAPIIILDEATSALDSVTEKHIQAGLHDLMQGRTTLVIAHRLSTLSAMDRILVFDQGKIIEDGKHEALLQQEGHYARMWHMQAGGFLPDTPDEH